MKKTFLLVQIFILTISSISFASFNEQKLKLREAKKNIGINERALDKIASLKANNPIWAFSRTDDISISSNKLATSILSMDKKNFNYSSRYGILLLKPDLIDSDKMTGIYITFDFPDIDKKNNYGIQLRKKLDKKIRTSNFNIHDYCDAVFLLKSSNNKKQFMKINFKEAKVSFFCNNSSFTGRVVFQKKHDRFSDEAFNLSVKGNFEDNKIKGNSKYSFYISNANRRFKTMIPYLIENYIAKQEFILQQKYNKISKKIDILRKKEAENLSDKNLCLQATGFENFKKVWGRYDISKAYVLEAKKRGLNCGIGVQERKENEALEKKKKAIAEKAKQEKVRQAELEREKRRHAEQEKINEAERKKKIEEEKRRKKKLAQEKARKKKLAEQERKRKLAQDKLKKQIANYKRRAKNFYRDIEEFVKAGGDIDLVLLSDFFDVKPNPQNKWNTSDLSNYKKLRELMTSIPQFVSFEKERIGERLKSSFAMKDQSIAQLEKNLSDLKGLMRKMFGSSEVPKIKSMIKDIQSTLSTFNQTAANNILNKSSSFIASKLSKPKIEKKTVKVASSTDTNWSTVKNDLTIQQQQFCQLTDRFYDNIDKARKSKNEIKVNMVHKERQENLDALIPQGNISNWIFKVIKIDQVEDGSAAVVLGLQCRSYVGSGQTIDVKKGMSKKDKKQWRATIPYNDRRFRELAKLDQGQFIVGSGTMLEISAYKPGQKETFYASQQIGEHPLTKGLNLEGELFIADLSYIAALN